MKVCECGCGQAAPIATRTDVKRGYIAGQPRRFIRGHNVERKAVTANPYRQVWSPGHPRGASVGEHIRVAEMALGKPLPRTARVHHVDGNPRNNLPSNLVVCQDETYHRLLHFRAEVIRRGGNPNEQKWCGRCGAVKRLDEFGSYPRNKIHGRASFCKACMSGYRAKHA